MYRKAYAILDSDAIFVFRLKLALQMLDMDNQNLYEYEIPEDFMNEFVMAKTTKYPFMLLFIDAKTGLHLVKDIRERYNGSVLIIIISDSLDKEQIKRAKAYKANAFLLKTGTFQAFVERLRKVKEKYIDNKSKIFTVYSDVEDCE